MQRAFDLALVEPAVRKLGVGMRADVVGGLDGAVEIVERDLLAGNDDSQDLALGEIAAVGGLDPAGIVAAHGSPNSRHSTVIPAQAGIQGSEVSPLGLDPRFRGGDDTCKAPGVQSVVYCANVWKANRAAQAPATTLGARARKAGRSSPKPTTRRSGWAVNRGCTAGFAEGGGNSATADVRVSARGSAGGRRERSRPGAAPAPLAWPLRGSLRGSRRAGRGPAVSLRTGAPRPRGRRRSPPEKSSSAGATSAIAASGIGLPISCWIAATALPSSGAARVRERPGLPARPVRPMR